MQVIASLIHMQGTASLLFLNILEDDWTWKDEKKYDGAVDKSSSNDRSVLRMESAFIMLQTGPIRLVLVDLIAGSLSDKNVLV